MAQKERFNRNLQVHSSQSPTVEEIIDELRATWQEPGETLSESVRRVISLARQGTLSDDETSTLLRYILAGFVVDKVDSMLTETELYPILLGWHPSVELRRKLPSMLLARVLSR